jgi:hypothetical protein
VLICFWVSGDVATAARRQAGNTFRGGPGQFGEDAGIGVGVMVIEECLSIAWTT